MPKVTPLLCNFNAGELSPLLDVRSDIQKYANGCRTLKNFIPMIEGGVKRMPGTYFGLEVKNSADYGRLIAFHYSTDQAYIIEAGNLYFRFWKDNGQIVIDTTMSDYDPTAAFFKGEYTKIGAYRDLDCGSSKHLYICSPYGMAGDTAIRISIETNTSDALAVATNTAETKTADPTSDYLVSGTWSGSVGSRYTLVDDYPDAAGSDEVIATSVGALLFGFTALSVPAGSTITSVQVLYYDKRTGIATDSVRAELRVGGSYSAATGHNPTTSWTSRTDTWTTNPKTGVAWTVDDVNGVGANAIQNFGFDVATFGATSESFSCIQLKVNYTPIKTINIKLASTTAASNAANLIQTAIRALATVDGVSVAAFTVTENDEYYASRPTSITTVTASVMTNLDKLYQCSVAILASDTNHNQFPYAEASYWTEVTAGNPVEIVTPYPDEKLFGLKGPQSADTLYIFHEDYATWKLIRHSHINWELVQINFVDSSDAKTITGITRAGSGSSKVYSKGHGFTASQKVFFWGIQGMTQLNYTTQTVNQADGVDAFLLNLDTRNYSTYLTGGACCRAITGITQADPAVVTQPNHGFSDGDQIKIMGVSGMTELNGNIYTVDNCDTNTYELLDTDSSAYGAWTAGGAGIKLTFVETGDYPSCGNFFEQRLMLGGFKNHPNRVMGSVSSDYENMTKNPDAADGAIEYTIPGGLNKVDRIRWLAAEEHLLLGTAGAVQKLGASTTVDPISDTNVNVKVQIGTGVGDIEPKLVTDGFVYLTRGLTVLRQIKWNSIEDKYTSNSLSRIASHIMYGATQLTSGVNDMAFQKEPTPILWLIRKDGVLLGMTYDIQEQVYGWFRVETDGYFESVAVLSNDGEEDQVWVLVKRTINGAIKRYVEYFMPQNFYSAIADAFFVHCGLTTTLASATQVTGLTHLALCGVDVVIAGVYIGRKTVSAGGVVTLGGTYSGKCHIGLPYTSTLEPMKLDPETRVGTARGKKQKINRVTVPVYETCGGQIGPDASNLVDIESFFETDVTVGDGVLVTDDAQVEFLGDWKNKATLCIVQAEPYPMTVLAAIPRVSVSED